MSKHYDTLETRSPAEREKALMQALPQQIANARDNAPFFATWLKDVDPAAVTSRAALAKLPVLRKAMLGEVQRQSPGGSPKSKASCPAGVHGQARLGGKQPP
jgi:phenylacetate-CoA ligase